MIAQKMTSAARDAQLQVALAELVVFDVVDCASAGHEARRSAPKDSAAENEGKPLLRYLYQNNIAKVFSGQVRQAT